MLLTTKSRKYNQWSCEVQVDNLRHRYSTVKRTQNAETIQINSVVAGNLRKEVAESTWRKLDWKSGGLTDEAGRESEHNMLRFYLMTLRW